MKIQIELLNEPSSYKLQLLAVDKYIKENTIKTEEFKFLGLVTSEIPEIKGTPQNTGVKIKLQETWREFYVDCKRTIKGVYKFKVWNG